MSGRILAMSDIHGCLTPLKAVLALCALKREDTLIVLGDCIDRGPESRQVIELLISLQDKCCLINILGNHEEMLLRTVMRRRSIEDWLPYGGSETLASYAPQHKSEEALQKIDQSHIEFIQTWRDYYETETHFFVHANYDPYEDLSRQNWDYLRWQSIRHEMPLPHASGKKAVFGHTAQKNGNVLQTEHLICLDTFCYGGGYLTLLDITNDRLYQVGLDGYARA